MSPECRPRLRRRQCRHREKEGSSAQHRRSLRRTFPHTAPVECRHQNYRIHPQNNSHLGTARVQSIPLRIVLQHRFPRRHSRAPHTDRKEARTAVDKLGQVRKGCRKARSCPLRTRHQNKWFRRGKPHHPVHRSPGQNRLHRSRKWLRSNSHPQRLHRR